MRTGRRRAAHFTLIAESLYGEVPASAGYGDKLLRVIGTADPGAVPGGSTRNRQRRRILMGPN